MTKDLNLMVSSFDIQVKDHNILTLQIQNIIIFWQDRAELAFHQYYLDLIAIG